MMAMAAIEGIIARVTACACLTVPSLLPSLEVGRSERRGQIGR